MTSVLPDAVVTLVTGDLPTAFVAEAITEGRAVVDTETSGLDWAADHLDLIQVGIPSARKVVLVRPADHPALLIRLLEDSAVEKIFHHACFDLRFLCSRWPVRPRHITCTKVTSKILRPNAGDEAHSLRSLVEMYCGVSLDKTLQRSDWSSLDLSQDQLSYAAQDVLFLAELRDRLMAEATSAEAIDLVQASCDYIPSRVLLDLSGAGDVFTH
jgi:ribonuclease D